MNKPTPEQVAQWAREAGMEQDYDCFYSMPEEIYVTLADLHRLVTRAMAEQAEADASLCEHSKQSIFEFGPEEVKQTGVNVCNNLAAAIRANAPKV